MVRASTFAAHEGALVRVVGGGLGIHIRHVDASVTLFGNDDLRTASNKDERELRQHGMCRQSSRPFLAPRFLAASPATPSLHFLTHAHRRAQR
ncbi:MAG TPA: hypothetical protein VH080_10250, partial [Gemmatimonadaceae bacterium]|nr:hypothetical protein [Gemmatimonadaceae bacterium]